MIPRNPTDEPSFGNRATQWVKRQLKTFSYHAGLHPALHNLVANDAVTLLYHKVQRRPTGLWGEPALSVQDFSEHLSFLTRHFEVVPLSLVVRARKGETTLPKRALAITFDDGYQHNLLLAAPVLKRFHVPATFFVSTGLVGTSRWMWAYELEEQFLRFSREDLARAFGEGPLASLCRQPGPTIDVFEKCVEYMKALPHPKLLRLLEALRKALPVEVDDENRFMSWDDVRALSADGFELGAHSVHHPILTQVALDEAERELKQSQQELEQQIGVRPMFFAYPNGNTSSEICALARKYYEASFVAHPNKARVSAWPLQELPRLSAPPSVAELSFELARQPLAPGRELFSAPPSIGAPSEWAP